MINNCSHTMIHANTEAKQIHKNIMCSRLAASSFNPFMVRVHG